MLTNQVRTKNGVGQSSCSYIEGPLRVKIDMVYEGRIALSRDVARTFKGGGGDTVETAG